MKKIRRRTTSGKNVIVLRREKAAKPVCGKCGMVMHGLKKADASQVGKLSKTEKSVNRPYGGNLCPCCSKEIFKTKARLV